MKQVDEMPTSGQFVAVWQYDGDIYCDTLKYDLDVIYSYQENENDYFYKIEDPYFYKSVGAKYFIPD